MTVKPTSNGRERLRGTTRAWAIAGALVAAACGDTDGTIVSGGAASPAPTEDERADEAASNPAVLFAEVVDSPDTRTVYARVLPSLPTGPLDRTTAYEFGSVYLFAYDGMVYVRDREAGTITRYQVTDALELVADKLPDGSDARFSTQLLGLRPSGMPLIFISPTRAYFLDTPDRRVVVWNPTTMQITSTFPIPNADKDGFDTGQIRRPVRVDDRIFAGIYQWDKYDDLRVHPGTGVLIFSATSDEPPILLEDSRITAADNLFADAAGDVYVVGTQGGGLYNVLGPGAGNLPPAGVLRIRNGETQFDPDFFVDLNAVTGSQAIVVPLFANGTTLVLQLWEPGVDVRTQVTTADDYNFAEEFIYGVVDLETQTFSRLPTIPKGGVYSNAEFRLDDTLYVQVFKNMNADEDLYTLTPTGVEAAFSITGGSLWNLERIR